MTKKEGDRLSEGIKGSEQQSPRCFYKQGSEQRSRHKLV